MTEKNENEKTKSMQPVRDEKSMRPHASIPGREYGTQDYELVFSRILSRLSKFLKDRSTKVKNALGVDRTGPENERKIHHAPIPVSLAENLEARIFL